MTGQPRDVHETLSYGKEERLARNAPFAAGLGLLGLAVLFVLLRDPDAKAAHVFAASVLIIAGLGFAVFALWRRKNPGEPMLVLSSAGIRYRLAKHLTVVIPWSEIADVATADITFHHKHVSWKQRDVPVVLISEPFYRSQVKPETWWHRGLAWKYHFIAKGDAVQVSFFHDVLSQSSADLSAAIEERWHAFSRHPNAQRPPAPRLTVRPSRRRLTHSRKLVAAVALAGLVLPLLWHWRWAHEWLRFNPGGGEAYLGQLLDRHGVPARRSDGRMVMLGRRDVAGVGTPDCHKNIARDPKADTVMPAYTASADCVADLALTSGMAAMAIFKLVVTTFEVQHEPGKYSQASAIVPAPLSLEEARQRLCELKRC